MSARSHPSEARVATPPSCRPHLPLSRWFIAHASACGKRLRVTIYRRGTGRRVGSVLPAPDVAVGFNLCPCWEVQPHGARRMHGGGKGIVRGGKAGGSLRGRTSRTAPTPISAPGQAIGLG